MSLSIRSHKRAICRRIGSTTSLSFQMPEPWYSIIMAQGDPAGFIKRALREHAARGRKQPPRASSRSA